MLKNPLMAASTSEISIKGAIASLSALLGCRIDHLAPFGQLSVIFFPEAPIEVGVFHETKITVMAAALLRTIA